MASNYTTEPLTYEPAANPTHDAAPPSSQAPRRRMSAHAQADADRALRHTFSWKPAPLERRQSWNKEDQKHDMHKNSIDSVKVGPGFSER